MRTCVQENTRKGKIMHVIPIVDLEGLLHLPWTMQKKESIGPGTRFGGLRAVFVQPQYQDPNQTSNFEMGHSNPTCCGTSDFLYG